MPQVRFPHGFCHLSTYISKLGPLGPEGASMGSPGGTAWFLEQWAWQ